jgi:hypothetical protein
MRTAVAVLVLLMISGCVTAYPSTRQPEVPGTVAHVVVCWLKEPGSNSQTQRLIDASHDLRKIPGVRYVFAGRRTPVNEPARPIDDTTFDVLVVMKFDTVQALKAYQSSAEHTETVRSVLQPLTSKVVVYDAIDPDEAADYFMRAALK